MDDEERGIVLGELRAGFKGLNGRVDGLEVEVKEIRKRLDSKRSFKWILKAIVAFLLGKHGG